MVAQTVSVAIDKSEIDALAKRLGRAVEDIQGAATEAAHATATWLRQRVGADLFAQTGIAQTLFERRVKKYVRTGVDAGGRVFVGLFRPEASLSNLLTLSQEAEGARGGSHFFKGAFVATMPNGFVGIFRRNSKFGRRGNPRLERISVEHVDLPSAQDLIAKHEIPAYVYFRREFDRRLQGVLS